MQADYDEYGRWRSLARGKLQIAVCLGCGTILPPLGSRIQAAGSTAGIAMDRIP